MKETIITMLQRFFKSHELDELEFEQFIREREYMNLGINWHQWRQENRLALQGGLLVPTNSPCEDHELSKRRNVRLVSSLLSASGVDGSSPWRSTLPDPHLIIKKRAFDEK